MLGGFAGLDRPAKGQPTGPELFSSEIGSSLRGYSHTPFLKHVPCHILYPIEINCKFYLSIQRAFVLDPKGRIKCLKNSQSRARGSCCANFSYTDLGKKRAGPGQGALPRKLGPAQGLASQSVRQASPGLRAHLQDRQAARSALRRRAQMRPRSWPFGCMSLWQTSSALQNILFCQS